MNRASIKQLDADRDQGSVLAEPRGSTAGRVAKNTVWLTAARIGGKIFALPLVILLARLLGPEDFGRWALVNSLVIILATVADAGFGQLTIRDLAPEPGKTRSYFRKSNQARLILTILAGLGLILWGFLAEDRANPVWLYAMAAVLLFPEALIKAGQAVLAARERMDLTSILSVAHAGGTVLVVGGALLLGLGLSGALGSLALINLVAAGAMLWFLRPYLTADSAETRSPLELVRQAAPYGVMALLSIVYFRMDVIMLASMGGPEAAGHYNAALRLFDTGLILPTALCGALFPVMSRQLAHGDLSGLGYSFDQAARLLLIAAIPAGLGGLFYSGPIIELLFGAEYQGAVTVMQVLAGTWTLFFVNALLGNVLAASELMPKFVPWAAANTGLNLVLNFIMIPVWGALGAALATLICELTGFLVHLVFARLVLGLWPRLIGPLLRPLLAALPAVAVWWWATGGGLNQWLGLVLGLAVYPLGLVLVRGVTRADREFVVRALSTWTGNPAETSPDSDY